MAEDKQNLALFSASMYISKASQDPESGEMRWQMTSSDTLPDEFDDEMTLELYRSFIEHIENGTLVPESYRSDFWKGGMPYLSVSHYSDGNGDSVPGMPNSVYIDGNMLKAKGEMYDNPLGKACFKALRESIQKSDSDRSPVRVSIGFLDFEHVHKSSGTRFVRKNIDDVCPECLKMFLSEGKLGGLQFIKGQLIHLALTRVPVNPRTLMEIDRSMTTKQEDAASIVGEELAEQIEETELNVPQKALVTKSDEEEVVEAEGADEAGIVPDLVPEEEPVVEVIELSQVMERLDGIEETLRSLAEPVEEEPHVLDAALAEFRSAFDSVDRSRTENLQSLAPNWDRLVEVVRGNFGVDSEGNEVQAPVADVVKSEVQAALQPVLDQLAVLMEGLKSQTPIEAKTTVQRGVTSVEQLVVNDPAEHARSQGEQNRPLSLKEQVRRSVGLQPRV